MDKTYRIIADYFTPFSEMPTNKEYTATLLQETEYHYTFEYNNDKGNKLKACISKVDYRQNPKLIQEV